MTRIYTKGGDKGETGLFGGQRVGKDHPRVATYGDVDELNAQLGLVLAFLAGTAAEAEVSPKLKRVQAQLFTVGSHLATPSDAPARAKLPPLEPTWATQFEREIDAADAVIVPLRHFILPGGSRAASALHLARTLCRRAERAIVALERTETVEPEVVVYMNRLSDWLFTMARLANHLQGVEEPIWDPNA